MHIHKYVIVSSFFLYFNCNYKYVDNKITYFIHIVLFYTDRQMDIIKFTIRYINVYIYMNIFNNII